MNEDEDTMVGKTIRGKKIVLALDLSFKTAQNPNKHE